MGSSANSRFRAIEVGLAVLVLLVMAITFTGLPRPYPAWPSMAGIPVNPEILVPGLLSIVVLFGTVRDGFSVGSVIVGLLSIFTVCMAVISFQTLLNPEPGGLFGGSLFMLVFGTALAIAVLARSIAREMGSPRYFVLGS